MELPAIDAVGQFTLVEQSESDSYETADTIDGAENEALIASRSQGCRLWIRITVSSYVSFNVADVGANCSIGMWDSTSLQGAWVCQGESSSTFSRITVSHLESHSRKFNSFISQDLSRYDTVMPQQQSETNSSRNKEASSKTRYLFECCGTALRTFETTHCCSEFIFYECVQSSPRGFDPAH